MISPGFRVPRFETWTVAFSVLLEPKGCSRKKALRQSPLLKRKPNAGLVSLTMACLSYLLVELTFLPKLVVELAAEPCRRNRWPYWLSRHARQERLNPIASNHLWFDRQAAFQH